jgi:hypothetical protein
MIRTRQQNRKKDIQALAEIYGVGWAGGPADDDEEEGRAEDDDEEDGRACEEDEDEEGRAEEEEEEAAARGSDGMLLNLNGAWGRITSNARRVKQVRKIVSAAMNGLAFTVGEEESW